MLFTSLFTELTTTKDLPEFTRPQASTNFHMEQETELHHSEFQLKLCMIMEEVMLKIEDQHQTLIHILSQPSFSIQAASKTLRQMPWFSTTQIGLNGFQQLEFQISELEKNFKFSSLKLSLNLIYFQIYLDKNQNFNQSKIHDLIQFKNSLIII